jgi:hypothetical protein
MAQLVNLYAEAKALVEVAFDALDILKGASSNHLTWGAIGHPEDELAASFVGDGTAVAEELFKFKLVGRLLELQMLSLGGGG